MTKPEVTPSGLCIVSCVLARVLFCYCFWAGILVISRKVRTDSHLDAPGVSLTKFAPFSLYDLGYFAVFNRLKKLNKNAVHYDELGTITENELYINDKTKVTIDELSTSNKSWLSNFMSK